MNPKIRTHILQSQASEQLDRLQDLLEEDHQKTNLLIEDLMNKERKLLIALSEILSCPDAKCKCVGQFKCVYCHGHDVFMEVTDVQKISKDNESSILS